MSVYRPQPLKGRLVVCGGLRLQQMQGRQRPGWGQGLLTIMNVSDEPRNWMFTKGATSVSSVPPESRWA
jgi:hypothetical protein